VKRFLIWTSSLLLALIVLLALSPMLIYWWGLSNLDTPPVPSQLELTSEQQRQIWVSEIIEPLQGLFLRHCWY